MSEDTVQVFQDGAGGYRWRRVAPNNEIISSGESFTRRHDAVRAAKRANPDVEVRSE